MKKQFLFILFITLSFSSVVEELNIGQNPYINIMINCINKTITIESNTTNSYYLFYAEEIIGVKHGFNVTIPFYGDIDKITEPFMLRCEGNDGYYTISFNIKECNIMDEFYIIKMIIFKTENINESANKTETYDNEPPIVTNLNLMPNNWTKTYVEITGVIEDNEEVYGYYYKCNKNENYKFISKQKIKFKCNNEGINTAYIIPVDINQNKGLEYNITYKIDRIPPTISLITVKPDWGKNSVDIEVHGFDIGGSKIKELHYSYDGINFMNKTYSIEKSFKCYKKGINKAYTYLVDNAGNIGKSYTVEYKIDRTSPYFKNFSIEYDDKGIFVWGSIDDNESGVKGYNYTCNETWQFI